MSTASLEKIDNTSIELELGDIIEINAPRNIQLHEQKFLLIILIQIKLNY